MGIVQVSKTYYPDPTDKTGRFGMIDVKWHQSFTLPVPLKIIKTMINFATLQSLNSPDCQLCP